MMNQLRAEDTVSESRTDEGVRELRPDAFVRELRQEVRAGFGLVPFIGSGCSAGSGILMGAEFSDYLGWTVYACLCKERPGGAWNLREQGWPAFPNQVQIQEARAWVLKEFKELAKYCELEVFTDAKGDRIIGVKRRASTAVHRQIHEPVVPAFLSAKSLEPLDSPSLHQALAAMPGSTFPKSGALRPDRSPTSTEAIVERGIRALHDWRATLMFLSELRLEATDGEQQLTLGTADRNIIDRFNVHITRGRRPNPIHAMLSHLREPARMRVILTTNFDKLIEAAFQEHFQHIDEVPVSIKGELPDPDLVHSRDTVVKLHGSLTETRADFSLDDEPPLEERRKFFHFVRGGYPLSQERRFTPGHLLVAGYSGSDRRCVEMIKFVLDSDSNAKVFWVCHSVSDVQRIQSRFPERDYTRQLMITVSPRFELLLLELYQQLCLRLPPGGDNFALNHLVPPMFKQQGSSIVPGAAKIVEAVRSALRAPETEWKRSKDDEGLPRSLFVVDGRSGTLPALAEASAQLSNEDRYSWIWLELEDHVSTASVAQQLFQSISEKQGLFRLTHALLCPTRFCVGAPATTEWRDHIRSFVKHSGIDTSRWLVSLAGRNGPGGCAGWWEGEFWSEDEHERFAVFLEALAAEGFVILYAPYTHLRRRRDEKRLAHLETMTLELAGSLDPFTKERLVKQVRETFRFPRVAFKPPKLEGKAATLGVRADDEDERGLTLARRNFIELDALPDSTPDVEFRRVMETVLHRDLRLNGNHEEIRRNFKFLHGVMLFRQSRQYSAMLSEGILSCPARFNSAARDNDFQRFQDLERRLKTYGIAPRVFLSKQGGFAWAYRDVRLGVRALAEAAAEIANHQRAPISQNQEGAITWPRDRALSRAHFHIAEWYGRAFTASGHAGSLTEAAFHFFWAAQHAHKYGFDATARPGESAAGPDSEPPKLQRDRVRRWFAAVCQLIRLLRIGRSSIRFWMEHGQRLAWFSEATVTRVHSDLVRSIPRSMDHRALADELLETLKQELLLLGYQDSPAGRVLGARLLNGPQLALGGDAGDKMAEHEARVPFWTGLRSMLGSSEPDWWRTAGPAPESCVPLLEAMFQKGRQRSPKDVVREWRQERFEAFLETPTAASIWIQELVECAYVTLRRCTLDERLEALSTSGAQRPNRMTLREIPQVGNGWLSVCVLASAALEVTSWHLPGNDEFLMKMRSKGESIYGLALAHLHRFYEAHRRLNHAQALLTRGGGAGTQVALGIIELRRAESYLIEAEVVRDLAGFPRRPPTKQASGDPAPTSSEAPEDPTSALRLQLDLKGDVKAARRLGSLRDDAWCATERAEALLSGRTHGSGWWVRLRTLQLWALSLDADITRRLDEHCEGAPDSGIRVHLGLTRRVRQDLPALAARLWAEGRAAVPDDWHNRLRLFDYYVQYFGALQRLNERKGTAAIPACLDPDIAEEMTHANASHSSMDARAKQYTAVLGQRVPVPSKSAPTPSIAAE